MVRKKSAASPLKQRKNPTQSRSETTVTAIIEAAARIFEEAGPNAYNTNAIAERAGVSIGSLYQYFPSKEAITRALIDRETAILLLEIRALGTEGSAHERLERLVQVAVSHQFRRDELSWLLDAEEEKLPPSDEVQSAAREVLAYVEDCLRQCGVGETERHSHAEDILSVVRTLVDAAGRRKETDHRAVVRRTWGVVHGFVGSLG